MEDLVCLLIPFLCQLLLLPLLVTEASDPFQTGG